MLKRGRPVTGNAKTYQYRLRLSADDVKKLEFIHKKTGKNKAEILRDGLNMQYNLAQYK